MQFNTYRVGEAISYYVDELNALKSSTTKDTIGLSDEIIKNNTAPLIKRKLLHKVIDAASETERALLLLATRMTFRELVHDRKHHDKNFETDSFCNLVINKANSIAKQRTDWSTRIQNYKDAQEQSRIDFEGRKATKNFIRALSGGEIKKDNLGIEFEEEENEL